MSIENLIKIPGAPIDRSKEYFAVVEFFGKPRMVVLKPSSNEYPHESILYHYMEEPVKKLPEDISKDVDNYMAEKHPFIWPKNKHGEDMVQPVGHIHPPFWRKHQNNIAPIRAAAEHYALKYSSLSATVDEDVMFDFIAWILSEGYDVIVNRSGPHFAKPHSNMIISVRHLFREYLHSFPTFLNYCNHHHKPTEDHEIVTIGGETFVANKSAIPLLKALNELGLHTRSHHIDPDGKGWITILLDGINYDERLVNETDATRTKYNGKRELFIGWGGYEGIARKTNFDESLDYIVELCGVLEKFPNDAQTVGNAIMNALSYVSNFRPGEPLMP